MRLFFIIGLVFLSGCMGSTAKVIKTPDGIIMTVGATGKVAYKDKEIEASYDTKNRSVVEDVISVMTLKEVNKD